MSFSHLGYGFFGLCEEDAIVDAYAAKRWACQCRVLDYEMVREALDGSAAAARPMLGESLRTVRRVV
jgi:hypothetical protein